MFRTGTGLFMSQIRFLLIVLLVELFIDSSNFTTTYISMFYWDVVDEYRAVHYC